MGRRRHPAGPGAASRTDPQGGGQLILASAQPGHARLPCIAASTTLAACDRTQVGNLVNETIGRYPPQLFKRYNFRHVSSLDEHEYHQMHFHIREVLRLNADSYTESFAGIEIPVLFMNGELDIYTTPHEARQFG